jgi:Tol biopolymer transport system component
MKTDDELERQLRSILRETLDRELGPDPVWPESPAARRVAELDRRSRRRWPLRVLAVAALIGAGGGAALLSGTLNPPPEVSLEATNGWIAFTVGQPDPAGVDDDLDIWLVALDRDARRVIGTDTDRVNQLCPAFSPDGRSLAYGRVEGHGTEYSADGVDRPAAYRKAALVVADVSDDGRVSDRLTIDVGDAPPPCPIWSPDGGQVAFGVPRTSPINPETSATGSEVWIVTLADRSIKVLPDLLATDLEWSPDGTQLAIASGADEHIPGEMLQDGRIHLYAPSSGAVRSLDATVGASYLTWSPDSRLIAYAGDDGLRVIDVETARQHVLAARFEANHGIGPVWSPNGQTIVYQRVCETNPADPSLPCREQHEVVLVTPGDPSDGAAIRREVVIPAFQATAQGSGWYLFPSRVTWSPDGEYLLYQAWSETRGAPSGSFLVAVPTDPDMPSVILAQVENMVSYEGYPDTSLVPIQSWGRQP